MSDTLTPEVTTLLAEQLPILATVTDAATPDIGPKRSLRVRDERTLVYNENTGGQHLRNIRAGSRAAVAVIDREALDGYRILGTPEVHDSGPVFDEAVAYAAERGLRPPKAAVLIRIDEIHTLRPGPTAGTRI